MMYLELKDLFIKATYLPLKPKLFFRIMQNYFYLVFSKRKILRYITIWATWKCQCHCAHCNNYKLMQSAKDKEVLSLKDYEKIFISAKKLGAINIHFVGGEPLLCDEICDLIRIAGPKSTVVSLTTNGILLKSKAKDLKKAGLDFMNVSIDSPFSAIHDSKKKFPGAFEAAVDGIIAAKNVRLKVIVTMVVTQQNLNNGEVEEMILLTKRLGVDLQLLPLRPAGNTSNNYEMLLDKDDMEKFYRLASSWRVRWDGRTNYFKTGCPAGIEKLTIDIFGNVYPCDFIPVSFGNIFESSLKNIYCIMSNSDMFKRWSSICRSSFDVEFIKKYIH